MRYIEQNKKEFEICGILRWHELGYTGKGIKMAEIENTIPDLPFFDGKLHDPYGICGNAVSNCHGQKVFDVMHQVAPDAELYALPSGIIYSNGELSGDFVTKTLPYAYVNNIHIINASLGGVNYDAINEKIRETQEYGTVFTTSAGNEGQKGLSGFGESNVWIAVGAVGWNDKYKEIFLKNYSSRGPELDVVCFSGLYIHDARNPDRVFQEEGTSFSAPMFAGMLALVQQFFLEKAGRTLYQDEMEQFVYDHVIDLGAEGFDEEYGHGLFVLPEPESIDVGKYLLRGGVEMKPQEFINLVKEGAIESYKQYKILPSITIAQAALESAWGRSHIQYNLFGIKWTEGCGFDKVARETTEYINGIAKKVVAYFRGYKSFSESILDHAKLLATARYAKVRQTQDYKQAAKALQECGYATDPKYAEKLISIIEQYRLYEIDREVQKVSDYEKHWAKAAIDKIKAAGLMSGYPDGSFKPDNPVTRAELASVLARLIEKGVIKS